MRVFRAHGSSPPPGSLRLGVPEPPQMTTLRRWREEMPEEFEFTQLRVPFRSKRVTG